MDTKVPHRAGVTGADSGFLLGLDIGGTKCAAVVGSPDGQVLHRRQAQTPSDPSDWRPAVEMLIGLVNGVCHDAGVSLAQASALGISCGGPLDPVEGVVYSPPNLPAWNAVPIRAILSERLGVARIVLENDANATALAEHRWGAGQGTQHMAFLTMGTGIGAGLILNGRLFQGKGDMAGEIGHAIIDSNGPPCLCGKRGCLEALASGTAIGRIGRERFHDPAVTAEVVCSRAREGDPVALSILSDAAQAMGLALANLLQTLDLERIVLGTLAVHAGDLLLEPIRKIAQANTWPRIWKGVQIVPAALGDSAQDLAALALAMPEKS